MGEFVKSHRRKCRWMNMALEHENVQGESYDESQIQVLKD